VLAVSAVTGTSLDKGRSARFPRSTQPVSQFYEWLAHGVNSRDRMQNGQR